MNQNVCAVPLVLTTDRLALISWNRSDAEELLPILVANWEHLSPWIPARVATPQPIPELAERLASNEQKFGANVEWRYAMRLKSSQVLLGEVAMFPRAAEGRVPFAMADRVEIGYWLRQDYNGSGLVTEAVTALLNIAQSVPQFQHFEIRCDPRNSRSVNIPRRLGFELDSMTDSTTSLYILQRQLND